MLGSIIIWVTFLAAIISSCLYFASFKKKKVLQFARGSFFAAEIGIIAASALLLILILQHKFEYNYVMRYSSLDLPLSLLVTSFWAGQEGSFLLWTFLAAIIGLILQRYTKRAKMESSAMTIYSLLLAFLALLITIKSPFKYVWDVPSNNLPVGFIPPDGRGLNPLLQNFWMIIHPPILFIGFASLAVPYILAITGLWQKKYREWIDSALPWVLFGAVSLGTGLILGGYWAYGVLGWGGWWGWDPVENSSLLPWMVIIILIHTMLIQKMTGRLVRTNFALAVLSFLLVIYSTFLTRSGILANASVHSFGHPGSLVYIVLLVWLIAFASIGIGMIILRWTGLKTKTSSRKWLTRESILAIASLVMGTSAAVILYGTNKPLFSDSGFEPTFYNGVNLPLAVLMTLLLGFCLRTKWNQENRKLFFRSLILPCVLSIIMTTALVIIVLNDILIALLVFTSLFALFISIENGYKAAKQQPLFIGGALSHIGLTLLFLGIIASGQYDQKQTVSLPINQSKSVFGYDLTYAGVLPVSDRKEKYLIEVGVNRSRTILEAVMIRSMHNDTIWSPDYFSTWKEDLYIEPVSIEDTLNIENRRTENIIAEISVKPFMNLVWGAAGLILIGSTIAMVRRSRWENEKKGAK